jgi:hypothetical protein
MAVKRSAVNASRLASRKLEDQGRYALSTLAA